MSNQGNLFVPDGLRFGLPGGSFNDPSRAYTEGVLLAAGLYPTDVPGRSYRPGQERGPLIIEDRTRGLELIGCVVHPKDAPRELSAKRGEGLAKERAEGVDFAIFGSDWFSEFDDRRVQKGYGPVVKICDLDYAKGRIVAATAKELVEEHSIRSVSDFFRYHHELIEAGKLDQILIGSEYPAHTRNFIMGNHAYRNIWGSAEPLTTRIDVPSEGTNTQVRIDVSHGKTEMMADLGRRLIIDLTQTGSTLVATDLVEIGKIKESTAGLYASSAMMRSTDTRTYVQELGQRLQAAARQVEGQRISALDLVREHSDLTVASLQRVFRKADLPEGLYKPLLAKRARKIIMRG